MNDVPMAVNPRTGAGVFGEGAFSAFQVLQNEREFAADELSEVHTRVLLELPFALHGITGSYTIDSTCVVSIEVVERPTNVAGYNIGLPDVSEAVRHMKLDPDIWGHVNFTSAALDFRGYRAIERPEGVEPLQATAHYSEILNDSTGTLNQLLDWYCLATHNYSVTRVSPASFVRFEAWHTLPPDTTPWNHTFVHFPSSTLSFEAPEREGDLPLMRRAMSYGKVGDQYSLSYALYAEARRALEANDARLAAIQGISSLEVALSHYIESRITEERQRLVEAGLSEELRVSMSGYNECKEKLTLQIKLRVIFPLLVPADALFPKSNADACDRLRKSRNKAIHEPQKFDPQTVRKELPHVRQLLDFLVAQHADGAATP